MKPQYKYQLHARIVSTGHKNMRIFSEKIGVNYAVLNTILNGRRWPGRLHIKAIAGGLGCTFAEVESLLGI